MTTGFSVQTPVFEGPLDLLLSLIEERKMLISDISLAEVADAFLSYVSTQGDFPLRDTAQFLVVAATLLLLKSRALLPVLTLSDEEESDVHDLERRLALLKIIKDASRQMMGRKRLCIIDGATVTDPLFVPPPDVSADSLIKAAKRVIENAPRSFSREEVEVEHVVSLDEMIERLTKRIERAITLTFREFSGEAGNPRELVVSFLAMLELVKRGLANVEQGSHFSEITIEYAGGSATPSYE